MRTITQALIAAPAAAALVLSSFTTAFATEATDAVDPGGASAPASERVVAALVNQGVNGPYEQGSAQDLVDAVDLINHFRSSDGLPALTYNVTLSKPTQPVADTLGAEGVRSGYTTAPAGMPAGGMFLGQTNYARWSSGFGVPAGFDELIDDPRATHIGIGVSNVGPDANGFHRQHVVIDLWSYPKTISVPGSYANPADAFPRRTTTAVAPVFKDKSGTVNDSVTLPQADGVLYYISGIRFLPGTYNFSGMVTVTAKAGAGYTLTGTTTWEHTLSTNTVVTPAAATFADKSGTAYDTYTVPAKTGVQYYVNGIAKAAGTYKASGAITVTAKAKTGYTLIGTTTWKRTFSKNIVVTPTAATFADKSGTTYDTYTIPTKAGVQYYVNGTAKAAGTYKASGTVTVTAKAKTGYTLTDTTSWKRTFSKNIVVTATAASFSDKSGTAYDRYTIPAKTGVQYYVNGVAKAAGTYKGSGTITVTAKAKTGYTLTGTTTWKRTFGR